MMLREGMKVALIQKYHLVTYISKARSSKHQLLSIYEKKMLVILFAIKKWEPYLVSQDFIIKINHQSLKYQLMQKITTISKQAWVAKFMQYDYEIVHKKGGKMWWEMHYLDCMEWKLTALQQQYSPSNY